MKTIYIVSLVTSFLFVLSCNNEGENSKIIKNDIIMEVTEAEKILFEDLRQGRIKDAMKFHLNDTNYVNIVNGVRRTYSQLDTALQNDLSKGVTGYNYKVNDRDFIIIDSSNVLETIDLNREIMSEKNINAEDKNVVMSLLWTKQTGAWKIKHLHSSYKG